MISRRWRWVGHVATWSNYIYIKNSSVGVLKLWSENQKLKTPLGRISELKWKGNIKINFKW
jgi:hypothetical protein